MVIKDQYWNVWSRFLTVILTVITPFLIWGSVKMIQDDMKIEIMWAQRDIYVTNEHFNLVIQSLNVQNMTMQKLITTIEVGPREDMQELKDQLKSQGLRIDRITETKRSMTEEQLKEFRKTGNR